MPASAGSEAGSAESAFISEVVHSLSQPLTVLHCTLELALQSDNTVEQLRASIVTALDNAERLRQRLLLVQALNDGEPAGETLEQTELSQILGELHEDMSPLFESVGRRFELHLHCSGLLVRVDRTRLVRALFVFMEYLHRYLPEGGLLSIDVAEGVGAQAEIRILAGSSLPVSAKGNACEAGQACEIQLLWRTLIAVGGEFLLLEEKPGRNVWLARLPLSPYP